MAENGAAQAPAQPRMNVLAQFIRDMSFENIAAQKQMSGEGAPDVQVQVNLDAQKREAEHQFQVAIKLNITSKSKDSGHELFILELDYSGIFHIEGVPEDQLHPFLLIECPRMLFPFVRRVVSDVTRDGGFPPLNLDSIDFVNMYRQEVARLQAAQQGQKADA